jgi:hypothetical protein
MTHPHQSKPQTPPTPNDTGERPTHRRVLVNGVEVDFVDDLARPRASAHC